jgi:hypothetical protein
MKTMAFSHSIRGGREASPERVGLTTANCHEGSPVDRVDSNHKPLMKPVVLEITETGADVSVSVQSDSTEPSS